MSEITVNWKTIASDRRVVLASSLIALSLAAIVILIAAKPEAAHGVRGLAVYTALIQALGVVAIVSFFTIALLVGKAFAKPPLARHQAISRSELLKKGFRLGRFAACSTNPNPALVEEWTEDTRDYFFSAIARFLDDYDVQETEYPAVLAEVVEGFEALIRVQPESHVAYALTNEEIERLVPEIFGPIGESPELISRTRRPAVTDLGVSPAEGFQPDRLGKNTEVRVL